MSSSSRSRSSAPVPHSPPPEEDPPKPLTSVTQSLSSSRRRSIAPSPFALPEDEKPSHEKLLQEIKHEPVIQGIEQQQGFRRSIAPEFEYGMGVIVERLTSEVKEEELEGKMGPPSSTSRRDERERTWTPIIEGECGGGYDDDARDEQGQANDDPRSGSVSTLFSRNEEDQDDEDRDGREIDYDDDNDDDRIGDPREGTIEEEGMTPEVESEEEKSEEEGSSDDTEPNRKVRAGGSLTTEKRKRKGKAKKGREPKKSKKELEKERIEQAAQLTSDFFSNLPMDPPQPALISIKARLTNTVAASTTHLPLRHQVLTVRQPSPRRRRTPTPPVLSRSTSPTLEPEDFPPRARGGSTQLRPTPSTFEDELEDYEEDPLPPPEELLDGFGAKPKLPLEHDFVSEFGKPRRLESRQEAIERWKLEIALESSNARRVPEPYSWISYRQTHNDLHDLLPALSPPLPPLLSLPRLFEAHPSLLSHLPPTSSLSHSIWSTIQSSEPLKIDSDSRLNRACWQLSEFMDRAGIEQIERNAEREGVGSEEFEAVARGVFEFEGTEFGFDEIKERNWLIAQQIVQLARIHKAFLRLSSPEILETFTSARHGRLQRLSTHLEEVKKEYAGIEDKRNIGNSQWILKLRGQMETIESKMQQTRTKFDRLEQNLRSVG